MYISKNGNMIAAGKVARDADMRRVGQKNTPLTQFTIKAGEKPSPDGGRPEAIWLTVKCWYDLAKLASGVQKGDHVLVTGKFQSKPYQDRNNRQQISNEIIAEWFSIMNTPVPEPPPPNAMYDEEEFAELPSDDGDTPF